jgi:hypothetical protein
MAEKFIGHFFCKGTQCSGISFSAEKHHLTHQNLSFGWKFLVPFFTPAFDWFITQFL